MVSYTSTRPLRKLVTYKYFFSLMSPLVAPLYTAPFPEPLSELSTSSTAWIEGGFAPWATSAWAFQPEIVPSSVTKMKTAGRLEGVPLSRMKSVGLPLKTIPVGVAVVPAGAVFGGGTKMKLSNALPAGSGKKLTGAPFAYTLETPVPLSLIQKGLVELRVSPQAFLRLGSTITAEPSEFAGCVMSDTRF